jgi:hypothetical protein
MVRAPRPPDVPRRLEAAVPVRVPQRGTSDRQRATSSRKVINAALTSLGRSCCVQWPQPGRMIVFRNRGGKSREIRDEPVHAAESKHEIALADDVERANRRLASAQLIMRSQEGRLGSACGDLSTRGVCAPSMTLPAKPPGRMSLGALLLGSGPRFARDALGPVLAFYTLWKLWGLLVGFVAATLVAWSRFGGNGDRPTRASCRPWVLESR